MRESRVRPDIQLDTLVLHLRCENLCAVHSPLQKMLKKPTVSPGREARDASFMCGRILQLDNC